MRIKSTLLVTLLVTTLSAGIAYAGEVHVAVAANFTAAMKKIAIDFEKTSGHKAIVSFGSTGKLYAQIGQGAPFDLFLAADQKRPALLVEADEASGRFTYAIGKLVVWSKHPEDALSNKTLVKGDFSKLAITNPKTAPYGAASVEVMQNIGAYDALKPKLVIGDTTTQTYQFIATGNADLGFIALAQIALDDSGSRWVVPDDLYNPIRQDAVLLKRGEGNPAATEFLEYLRSDAAREIIHTYGYGAD